MNTQSLIPLVDADSLVYAIAHKFSEVSNDEACEEMDKAIAGILIDATQQKEEPITNYHVFIGGNTNFRKLINPGYKANRPPKPAKYDALREHLKIHWKAIESQNCEADDLCGIYQTDKTIICSIDKDLLQIPGYHYKIGKGVTLYVSELAGYFSYYSQVLTGDRADNVTGLEKVGPIAAEKILGDATTPVEFCKRVVAEYKARGKTYPYFLATAQQLYVQRKVGELWQPPYPVESF